MAVVLLVIAAFGAVLWGCERYLAKKDAEEMARQREMARRAAHRAQAELAAKAKTRAHRRKETE